MIKVAKMLIRPYASCVQIQDRKCFRYKLSKEQNMLVACRLVYDDKQLNIEHAGVTGYLSKSKLHAAEINLP